MEHKILEELHVVRSKVDALDKEVARLREDYNDKHLSKNEAILLAEALEEEKNGKTISATALKKKLGL